jgi:hypothetical protein
MEIQDDDAGSWNEGGRKMNEWLNSVSAKDAYFSVGFVLSLSKAMADGC